MADVFISYAHQDRELARGLAEDLMAWGYSVWWDAELLGSDDFYEVIISALTHARAAVVIWTPASTRSRFVRDEARFALHQNKLVATMTPGLNVYEIPFGFQGQHTVSVADRSPIVRSLQKLGVQPSRRGSSQAEAHEAALAWQQISGTHDVDQLMAYLERYPTSAYRPAAAQRAQKLIGRGAVPKNRVRLSNLSAFFRGLTFRAPEFHFGLPRVVASIGRSIGIVTFIASSIVLWSFPARNLLSHDRLFAQLSICLLYTSDAADE